MRISFDVDDTLVCGYHGWTYRTDGVCVRIPQRENPENVSPSVRVPAYRLFPTRTGTLHYPVRSYSPPRVGTSAPMRTPAPRPTVHAIGHR